MVGFSIILFDMMFFFILLSMHVAFCLYIERERLQNLPCILLVWYGLVELNFIIIIFLCYDFFLNFFFFLRLKEEVVNDASKARK